MSLQIASFKETKEIGKRVARMLNTEFKENFDNYATFSSKFSNGQFPKRRNIIEKIIHDEISVSCFPDEESLVKLNKNPKDSALIIISSLARNPNKKIIETILAADSARENGADKVILFATYLPYMRQDKIFNNYEGISAKNILRTLSQHFDKVFVIDPHLHRIKTLKSIAKNCHEISSINLIADYIKKHLKQDFMLVGPDAESKQWDKNIAKLLNKKAIILQKTRFSSDKVKIKSEHIANKNILIIDDIISTGHTILETIKTARKHGVKDINVIGIHGIFANNSDKLIKKHANLITTNTIPNKYSKIDTSPLIAETIKNYVIANNINNRKRIVIC